MELNKTRPWGDRVLFTSPNWSLVQLFILAILRGELHVVLDIYKIEYYSYSTLYKMTGSSPGGLEPWQRKTFRQGEKPPSLLEVTCPPFLYLSLNNLLLYKPNADDATVCQIF